MEKKISVREGAKEIVLDWIIKNNKHSSTFTYQLLSDSLENCIERVKKNAMKNWDITFSGTAGFTVLFTPESDEYGTIEILVDPCVSKELPYNYI